MFALYRMIVTVTVVFLQKLSCSFSWQNSSFSFCNLVVSVNQTVSIFTVNLVSYSLFNLLELKKGSS